MFLSMISLARDITSSGKRLGKTATPLSLSSFKVPFNSEGIFFWKFES